MPKARPAYGKNAVSSFSGTPASLTPSRNEMKRVKQICDDPAFVSKVTEMSRLFRALRNIGTPGATEIAATLDDLTQRLDDLHHKLHELPIAVGRLIIENKHHIINNALSAMTLLHVEIQRARAQVQPGRGREENHVGVEAAKALREVFARHGLEFSAAGDNPHKSIKLTGSPSCDCLRIVLGLPEGTRVEHLIKQLPAQ